MYYSLTFPGKVISHILQSGVILHDRRYTVGEYKDTQDSYFPWVILDWHRHGAWVRLFPRNEIQRISGYLVNNLVY